MCAGLLTATVASRIHRAAQPALLYLVPFTLLPLLTMAYLKVLTPRLIPFWRCDPKLSFRAECTSLDTCVVSRATCGVCGLSLSTPSPAALAFWRYDAPRDKRTSVGRTVDPLPFRRGKERGRAHSEAVSSSLVHAFPPVKTLQKDTSVCGSQGPNAPHLWAPHISTSSSLSHILSVLFLLPPFLPSPFFPFATLPLLSSFPLLPSGLSSLCFPSFFVRLYSFCLR